MAPPAAAATRACCDARASMRPVWRIRRATARAESLARELLAVAHGRPHAGLDVGHRLSDVVAVVVHPFVEQLTHAKKSDLGMLAAALEIGLAERPHERRALAAQGPELVEQCRHRPRAVGPGPRHLSLIP